ncbi:MAG: hypothetical protein MUF71_11890 [Candidatus Kapabacteria bacterium]|jgi:hypothetical protein|nr:hypothetical protein [Candidatus Kapabacteria bacterium]
MLSALKNALSRLWHTSNFNNKLSRLLEIHTEDFLQRHLFQNPRYASPQRLNRFEFKVYSQNGEDGIIEEIFKRIGTTNKFFVEFGVGNGLENNSAYLLVKDWSGLWLEGDRASVEFIKSEFAREIAAKRLRVQETFITAENIAALFEQHSVPQEPDMLSIDIDGNDYHIWKALHAYRPRVIVVEYNATFPPPMVWIKKYNPTWQWDGSIGFGASLKAFEELGKERGYSLVACNFVGANAFFVRNDLLGNKFHAPFTAEEHYEPHRSQIRYTTGHTRRMHEKHEG